MNIGEGAGADKYFKWIGGDGSPENVHPSLLIRFIKAIDGKYKTSKVDFRPVYF